MIEKNPEKIKKAEIVVGIPSKNEADNMSNITKQIDRGLQKYFKGKKAAIINTDSKSSDNTGEIFLNTQTKTAKIYLSTPAGINGKGRGLRNFFLKMTELGARAGATIDADIKSVTPEWAKCLLGPIGEGYDYLTPLYIRDKNDGTITNHICYPLVYGLLGYDIRQPIGGDFGFSRKFIQYALKQKWNGEIKNYGIDIFMTLNAIKGKFKIGQVDLGSKIHKPSAPKLDEMFLQVVDTLFRLLEENKNLWNKKVKIIQPPLVCGAGNKIGHQELNIDYEKIKKTAISEFEDNYNLVEEYLPNGLRSQLEIIFVKKKSLEMDGELWLKIVYELFQLYCVKENKKGIIELLRALYFGKIFSSRYQRGDGNGKESEKAIKEAARRFFKSRNYLLSLFS